MPNWGINYGLLDTNLPAKIGGSIREGQDNALARMARQRQQDLADYQLNSAMKADQLEAARGKAYATGAGDLEKTSAALLSSGDYKGSMELQKQMREQEKADVALAKTKAETGKIGIEAMGLTTKQFRDGLASSQTPQQWAAQVQSMAQDPVFSGVIAKMGGVDKILSSIPQDPKAWMAHKAEGISDATQWLKQNMPSADARLQAQTSTANTAATNQRMISEGALNRGVQMRGQDVTQAAKRNAPMSVALQKELIESDDVKQASKNVVNTLKEALKLNKTAYSGYGAKGRAVLRSNLPGESAAADATINIDNMMTGQALENLKVIFGGMPTEGERKILMEMQASADKTPAQRESIMNRAIAAAERRGEFASKKAKAIRGGEYLTTGMEEDQAAVNPIDSLLEKYK